MNKTKKFSPDGQGSVIAASQELALPENITRTSTTQSGISPAIPSPNFSNRIFWKVAFQGEVI